jgi:hypothetical protein
MSAFHWTWYSYPFAPPQFQASRWQRLFTLDMASLKKWLLFLLPFHSCACIFISYCCLCQCQAMCYYYMPAPTKYHWNISFQNKCSSKYVVKNARNVTQFVWQPFSIEFQGFVFVFFIFKSAGEGEGWFEGDSTWLIHYTKKHQKNTDSHPAVLLNSFKFCAPVVLIWFWLFFSCLRRRGAAV